MIAIFHLFPNQQHTPHTQHQSIGELEDSPKESTEQYDREQVTCSTRHANIHSNETTQVEQGACGVEWVWVKDWSSLSRKTPGRTRKGSTTNDERIKTNRKECFKNKNEAKPCQKKQALQKDFDKIAPSRPIILRGGISQREKRNLNQQKKR